jgi:biotin carboxyl carrier protein
VTVDIELDGTRRRVALRRNGDGWIAGVDGREVEVSVVEVGGGWSMLVGEFLPPSAFAHGATADKEGGSHDSRSVASGFSLKSYDVAFDQASGGGLIVQVNGVAVPVTLIEPGPAFAPAGLWRGKPSMPWAIAARGGRRAGRDGEAGTGPRTIVAPMPGRIVRVLVKPDETVVAHQPLVVIEAMKMENELRAPRSGIVADVRVAEGASVEANTVLVVLR